MNTNLSHTHWVRIHASGNTDVSVLSGATLMEDWRRICTPAKAALDGFAYRYEHATNHGQCVKSPLAANDMAKTCEPDNAENLSKLCYKPAHDTVPNKGAQARRKPFVERRCSDCGGSRPTSLGLRPALINSCAI